MNSVQTFVSGAVWTGGVRLNPAKTPSCCRLCQFSSWLNKEPIQYFTYLLYCLCGFTSFYVLLLCFLSMYYLFFILWFNVGASEEMTQLSQSCILILYLHKYILHFYHNNVSSPLYLHSVMEYRHKSFELYSFMCKSLLAYINVVQCHHLKINKRETAWVALWMCVDLL